jgi:hypothetical protein
LPMPYRKPWRIVVLPFNLSNCNWNINAIRKPVTPWY